MEISDFQKSEFPRGEKFADIFRLFESLRLLNNFSEVSKFFYETFSDLSQISEDFFFFSANLPLSEQRTFLDFSRKC